MYIEPCCVDRQLPQLLREHVNHAVFFQTSGDVTVMKFMQAVSSMVSAPYTMVLVIPEIDRALLRTINYYFQRNWQGGLILLTKQDQSELIKSVLSSDILNKVQYTNDKLVSNSLLGFLGQPFTRSDQPQRQLRESVVIQGEMLSKKDFSFSLYAGSFAIDDGTSDKSLWSLAVAPVISKLKVKPLISATDGATVKAFKWK